VKIKPLALLRNCTLRFCIVATIIGMGLSCASHAMAVTRTHIHDGYGDDGPVDDGPVDDGPVDDGPVGQGYSAETDDAVVDVVSRFSDLENAVSPDFQRHVVPLFGRLGCNGRACHGSFQGQGGFQLSLFGYDFNADHAALLDKQRSRIDLENADASLILRKPTDEYNHEGGQRFEKDGWEYRLLKQWVESGAEPKTELESLVELQVEPAEIIFATENESVALKVIAVWPDGTKEDVTALCRFRTNDSQIANVDETGLVSGGISGDSHVVVFYDKAVVPIPVIRSIDPAAVANYPDISEPTEIDRLVGQKLRKLGIVPSEVCDDVTFLRRVSLDLTGTLPTPEEVRQFIADPSPGKRAEKVEQLLETKGYAAWWTTRLSDWTGNNSEQLQNAMPMQGQASQQWYDWIYQRVESNMPYDQIVEGIVVANDRKPDETYTEYCSRMSDMAREGVNAEDLETLPHYWMRREFQNGENRAISFAHAFLGVRIQCAQCHKHPFDQWSKDDFTKFTKFFEGVRFTRNGVSPEDRAEYQKMIEQLGLKDKRGGEVRRELPKLLEAGKTVPFPSLVVRPPAPPRNRNRNRNRNQNLQQVVVGQILGQQQVDLTKVRDAREPLMQWLRDPNNPYFARAFVNRVWANYFHAGIVSPTDDFNQANPPSNAALLDYLTQGFIDSGYDMKWVHREIVNSDAYQRSWQPNESNAGDRRNFSHAIARRMPAEVLYDAIQSATASDAVLANLRDRTNGRAITTAGTFRNNRGIGYAMQVFGRSTRSNNCDCDRSEQTSLLQTVYLQNDQELHQLIDRPKGGWIGHLSKSFGQVNLDRQQSQQLARFENNLRQLEKQKARAEKSDQQQQLEKIERQIAQVQKRMKPLLDIKDAKPRDDAPSDEQIVIEAYLRTLSRTPTADEMDRCLRHMSDGTDKVANARGLLWALINTKEFVVIH
jgi:hypothetical protein